MQNSKSSSLKKSLLNREFWIEIRDYAFVFFVNLVLAFLALGVWGKSHTSPWTRGGDGDLNFILVRNIERSGWFFDNSYLGAPGKSQIYDLPQGGENLQFLILKLLSGFTNAAGAVNIYFLLTFPIISIAGYAAAKWWVLQKSTSFLVATLYAFLPYHFFRNESHLLLSMYAFIPLVVVYSWKSTFEQIKLSKWKWILLVLVFSSVNSYYTVFTILIISSAFAFNLIRKKRINFRQHLILLGSVISLFFLNHLSSIIYFIRYGTNSAVDDRGYAGAEVFGLQLTDMFLPRPNHRIGIFSEAGIAVSNAGLKSEGGQAIGIVSALGVIALLLFGIYKVIRFEKMPERFHFFFILVVGMIVFTVSSGPTLILGMAGFTQVRSWNRVVVIIAFVGLLIFGHLLEVSFRKRNTRKMFQILILLGVLIIGLLDQTSPADKFDVEKIARVQQSECELIEKMEASKSDSKNVLQLPHVPFPDDGKVGKLGVYEQGLATLCDSELRFSFGAVRGRNDDLQRKLLGDGDCDSVDECKRFDSQFIPDINTLKASDFDYVLLYRAGYRDNGESVEIQLTEQLGEGLESADKSQIAFFLRR